MRVLFVLPLFSLGREPLGILYLSSVLKTSGHQTMAALPRRRDVLKAAMSFQPHIQLPRRCSNSHERRSLESYFSLLHRVAQNWLSKSVSGSCSRA